jgi:gamma-glutamyltranspeptidase / glutathione hydrolase
VRNGGVSGHSIPRTDLNSVTVPGRDIEYDVESRRLGLRFYPGAAAAWVDVVEKFGSGKMSVADVLAPAIRLAEEGYAIQQS